MLTEVKMDLDIIREFTVLAETCNFQTAANSLSLSQSALSKHIRKLEDELDLQLFDRTKRNVVLNENGIIFQQYARELCKNYDELKNALQVKRRQDLDCISVGIYRIDQFQLIEKLADFCTLHPEVHMNIIDHNRDQMKSKLTSGECDFTFTAEISEFNEEDYDRIVYRTDRMVVLVPASHPFAVKNAIDFRELMSERIIEHCVPLEQQLLSVLCRKYDCKPNITARINYSATIMRMVEQGMGISLISDSCTKHYESHGLVKVPLMPTTSFDIYLVFRRRGMNKAAKAFINYIRNMNSPAQ